MRNSFWKRLIWLSVYCVYLESRAVHVVLVEVSQETKGAGTTNMDESWMTR